MCAPGATRIKRKFHIQLQPSTNSSVIFQCVTGFNLFCISKASILGSLLARIHKNFAPKICIEAALYLHCLKLCSLRSPKCYCRSRLSADCPLQYQGFYPLSGGMPSLPPLFHLAGVYCIRVNKMTILRPKLNRTRVQT